MLGSVERILEPHIATLWMPKKLDFFLSENSAKSPKDRRSNDARPRASTVPALVSHRWRDGGTFGGAIGGALGGSRGGG